MYYLLETVGGAQFDNTALELCQRNGKTESVEWLVSPRRVMHPRARASRIAREQRVRASRHTVATPADRAHGVDGSCDETSSIRSEERATGCS